MLMPKKNRVLIYEYLFKEGVLVAKKDLHAPKHSDLLNVPNLQVIKALQSLHSRGYVKEQFAWRHYYWYLTNEGIQYLREFLKLPPEIVPSTLKRQQRPETSRPPRPKLPDAPSKPEGERDRYRRAPGPGGDKRSEVGLGSGANLEFRGGFGRGSRNPPQ